MEWFWLLNKSGLNESQLNDFVPALRGRHKVVLIIHPTPRFVIPTPPPTTNSVLSCVGPPIGGPTHDKTELELVVGVGGGSWWWLEG